MVRCLVLVVALSAVVLLGEGITSGSSDAASIGGRVFIDLNGNGVWDGNDVAVPYENVYASAGDVAADTANEQGLYSFTGLSADHYEIGPGQGPCADYFNIFWPGEYIIGFCPINIPPNFAIDLAPSDNKTQDIAYSPFTATLNGRLWNGDAAAPDGTPLSVFVGARECWTVTTELKRDGATMASTFSIPIEPNSADPKCQGDAIGLRAPGGSNVYFVHWDEFWRAELHDWLYEGDWPEIDAGAPPFRVFGSLGGADYPGGETLSAEMNGQVCGFTTTVQAAVIGSQAVHYAVGVGQARAGCGTEGDPVAFCLDRQLLDSGAPVTYQEQSRLLNLGLASPAEACPLAVYPDTNCDRLLTPLDILTTLWELAGQPPDHCPPAGDVNCDDTLTVADVVTSLAWMTNVNPHLLYECRPFNGFPGGPPVPFPPESPTPVPTS